MVIPGKRLGWPCLLCATCLAVVGAPPVLAQPGPAAAGFNGQAPAVPVPGGAVPAFNGSAAFAGLGPVGRVTSVSNPGSLGVSGSFAPTAGTSIPGGYGGGGYYPPFYPYYAPDYNAGYLRGTADVLSAGGSLAVRLEQARLVNQQVVAAKLENHKRLWDQWLYERSNMPTLQDERERWNQLATRRALTDPPATEILQATTLNQLLRNLKGKTNGRPVPLDENVVRKINVIDPNGGNLGALKPAKEGTSLSWPQSLKGDAYRDEIKQVNQRVADLLKQAEFKGEVDPGGVENLKTAIAKLRAKVQAAQGNLTLMQQIDAKRFLNQLDAARQALSKPRAADFITGKLAPKGKTVPELLNNMYSSGLEFAPSTDGDEAEYVALYNALLNYAQSVGLGGSGSGSVSYPAPAP
jgi:hypothetical protein